MQQDWRWGARCTLLGMTADNWRTQFWIWRTLAGEGKKKHRKTVKQRLQTDGSLQDLDTTRKWKQPHKQTQGTKKRGVNYFKHSGTFRTAGTDANPRCTQEALFICSLFSAPSSLFLIRPPACDLEIDHRAQSWRVPQRLRWILKKGARREGARGDVCGFCFESSIRQKKLEKMQIH